MIGLTALGGDAKRPLFALLTQGFPRLVTVTATTLPAEGDDTELLEGALGPVRLNDDDALVPDLAALQHQIAAALAPAP